MPVMTGSTSVLANVTSPNIFAGNLFEFLSRNRRLAFRLSSAATGIFLTFTIGGVVVAQDVLISDSNRFPILPDDLLVTVGGRRGARLFATLRNSTGGTLITEWVLDIN